PARPYSLYYMVFINGSSQMGLKAPDIQKIIGRVAQIVNDNSSVRPQELQPWLDSAEPPIVLSQAKMALEEKVRVWQAINKPYQISLFYKAAPVFLSSEMMIEPPRVSDASFGINLMGKERGSE
ncbi:MAG: Pvc16 family protein, partial [Lachnospiraceae bacterium]